MISPKGRKVRRRIPIRIKLAAALAIPITALLLVSLLEVIQSAKASDEIQEQTTLAESSIGPGGLVTVLQNERNYGAVWLLGSENAVQLPVASFEEAVTDTDASLAQFQEEIDRLGGSVKATYQPAVDQINADLANLRNYVTSFTGERGQNNTATSEPFYLGYIELIDNLFEANGQVALAVDDSTLRRGVELTDLASRQIENTGRIIRVFLLAGVGPGGKLDTSQEIGEAAGLVGQYDTNLATIQQLAVGRYEAAVAKGLKESADSGFAELAHTGLAEAGQAPVNVGAFLESTSREEDEGLYGVRTAVNERIQERAAELREEAAQSQRLYMGLALVAIVVALLVTWLVSRSITRPLRSLTRQAKEMAERRLPEAVIDILETPLGDDVTVPTVDPVRVNTRDEVSDVADALNTVQDSALDLAVEQAVLRRNIADSFVNLGRRNQNLLGRQLDFITELETNETDADTLANLFRLDHLATRMRRNAESLLVLAGIDPPRQWAAPVRLTDVIRAALGEVEDYQRVTVRGVEPATILGSAAADRPTCWPSSSRTPWCSRRPTRRSTSGAATGRRATRWPSSTRAWACRPRTWPPPTGAWPGPSRSPSPRRSTWAITWPATWRPATTSRSTWTTRRATASPPPSRSRTRCSPPSSRSPTRSARPTALPRWAWPRPACTRRRPRRRPPRSTGPRRQPQPPRPARRGPAWTCSPRARPPCRSSPWPAAPSCRPSPHARPAAWSSGHGGPASRRRPPRSCRTATCWPACPASPTPTRAGCRCPARRPCRRPSPCRRRRCGPLSTRASTR